MFSWKITMTCLIGVAVVSAARASAAATRPASIASGQTRSGAVSSSSGSLQEICDEVQDRFLITEAGDTMMNAADAGLPLADGLDHALWGLAASGLYGLRSA